MNMQTLEHDSTAVACVSADNETPSAGYEAVRFNAMKHGILSRLAVLAHEDQPSSATCWPRYWMNINRPA
jgi:hypothetical protein